MAESGYGCVFGDCRAPINHLVTTMDSGATVSLCDEHFPAGLIPLLAAELGVDPGDFYGHVEKYLKAQAKKAERELADAQAAEAAKGSQPPAASPGGDQGQGHDDHGIERATAGYAGQGTGDAT